MIAKSHRWQKTAVAVAAIALLGLSTTGAMALSLGRITVLSALGEPLRAEIEIPDINAEEAASLKTAVAAPDAFVAAGLDFNPAMSSVQASLQRRADGRAYIRLTSDRPINDPFVDMILETSWSSGRIVRDYTMLFDPPTLRKTAPAPTLAQTTTAPQAAPAAATPKAAPVAAAPAPAPVAAEPARKAATPKSSKPAAAPKVAAEAPATPAAGSDRVTIQSGDTATKIATRTKPAGVSLDQMLVALLRANPDAFVRENINRIRTGAVMTVPTAEQAQAISTSEASQTVVAHSKDFNEFRRNLAANAPAAAVGTAARKASGTVEAKVEDKKPSAATPDKLTLSKGAIQSKATEEKIAKERSQKEATERAAEIAKNTAELEKVRTASAAAAAAAVAKAPAAAASQTKAPAVPAVTIPAVAAPVAPPASDAVASTPIAATPAIAASAPEAGASAPAETTSAPAEVASASPAPLPAPMKLEEPSLLDDLMDNLWLPAAAGGLLALLGGFAFWRVRQRKKNGSQMDSSFLESRLQPDSFFGASGGQRVDTNSDAGATGSSMVYSASQLDAADDVDPVAEADVYLAYGRDLQAEEILKEAVRTNPGRLAIHTKLLEIFAKRRDAKSYETSATQAFKLTGSDSPDWARICGVGLDLDPNNPLYQPGGAPGDGTGYAPEQDSSSFGNSTIPVMPHADLEASAPAGDLDLDLDFSLDDEPASAISDVTGGQFTQTAQESASSLPVADTDGALDMGMDFDLSEDEPAPAPEVAAPTELPLVSLEMDGVSLSMDAPTPAVTYASTDTMPLDTAAAPVATASDMGMLEFDMGSLSLDLDTPVEQPTAAPEITSADPLETKLALAEEFVSIGDDDGARALIEEVISEATGDVRAKAQRALANLS